MAVEVGERFGVVGDHGVEIEGLRVGEVGIGDRCWDGGPIRAQPSTEAVGVVARAEVVVAGFGVALLAFEFVILRAGVGVGAFAAVRIEIRIVTDHTRCVGDYARGAEEVFDVVDGIAASGKHGDTLAAEENVFGGGVAADLGFGKDFAAGTIPVELARGFGDTAAVAVVRVGNARGGLQLALGIPRVGIHAVVLGVPGKIVRKNVEMVVSVGGDGEAAFLGTAGVVRVGSGGDGLQVAPGVDAVVFAPAVSRA